MSQPEEKLQPGPEPEVPGEQGPEEEHQKEHRSQALRALVLARKKRAGLMSPEGKTTYLLGIYYGPAMLFERADEGPVP